MQLMKKETKIVVGICGGIAAYKSADLISKFVQTGTNVKVIMTEHATQFITPLTIAALSKNPVLTGNFESSLSGEISHIKIMETADAVIVAPATANIIAKIANGIADDILTTAILMAKCPVILAPAMNTIMYDNPATKVNLSILENRGCHIVGPANGHLACGYEGKGRMEEPSVIFEELKKILSKQDTLSDVSILISAGATREHWDPVRFLSNPSTGKMGFALAKEASSRGAKITLVSGPTYLLPPQNVRFISTISAEDMRNAILQEFPNSDIFISSAAVSDFRPATKNISKLKKTNSGAAITLTLEQTPDILKEISAHKQQGQIIVGFAAETENLIENACKKLKEKHLDFIVANDISLPGAGFGSDTNQVTIIDAKGKIDSLPIMTKQLVAETIIDKITEYLAK